MVSEIQPDELKLLGATVELSDGRSGTVKELRPNRPWYFSIETEGQPETSVQLSGISIGGRKLSDFLTQHGAALDREGWSSLVSANYPYGPAGPPQSGCPEGPPAAKYRAGRVKWFGGTNSHTGKQNQFGFVTSAQGGDVYFHKSAIRNGPGSFNSGEPVVFSLGGQAGSTPAADSLHAVRLINEVSSLREFLIQGSEDARSLLLAQAKACLTNGQFLSFANDVLDHLGPGDLSYIYKQCGPLLVLEAEARPILGMLKPDDQVELFSWLPDLSEVQESVVALLGSDAFSKAPEDARSRFWARHKPKDAESPLYPFLDPEAKRAIWRDTVLPTLPLKVRVEALLRERAKLSPEDWRSLAFRLIRDAGDDGERSQILRAVPASVQLDYLGDSESWQPFKDVTYSALSQIPTDGPEQGILDKFWLRHRPKETTDSLYPLAPARIQKEIWREKVLPKLPIAERIDGLKGEASTMSPQESTALSLWLLRLAESFDERVAFMRALPAAVGLGFIGEAADWKSYRETACSVLERNEDVPPEVLAAFWRKAVPETPKDPLYRFAPVATKRAVCRSYYGETIRTIASVFPHDAPKPASVPASEIYKALSEKDRELAGLWQHGRGDPERAQMLSARGAELAAFRFYAGKGHAVQDIASHQVEGNGGDWRTHDILLDGEIPVDVKNSRCPKNNSNFYVEHTVPRFKVDRRSRHVRIAGVLSPYLQLKYIDAPETARFDIEPIRFLGETSWPEIERLVENFSSDRLEVRNVVDRVVPHWLFDYPDAWYGGYPDIKAKLSVVEWPSEEEWQFVADRGAEIELVPQLCAAGIPLPGYFLLVLPAWQTALYRKIQAACPDRPHLPAIFLAVLTDFLENIQDPPEGYSPEAYKSILYGSRYQPEGSDNSPLGLVDPVGMVDSLCSSLEILWNRRQLLDLARFKNFRFSGLGLLQGREGISSPWETILAYCGGREYARDAENKVVVDGDGKPAQVLGKCGQAPLVLGRESLCPTCHKLICRSCGFCSQRCEQERFEEIAKNNRRILAEDSFENGGPQFGDAVIPAYAAEELPLEFYEDELRRS